MKRLTLLALIILLVCALGCVGETQQPVNETEKNKTIIIVTEPQKNITQIRNESYGETEENITEEKIEEVGVNYTYAPSEKLGVYFIDVCDYSSGEHGSSIFIKKGDFDMLIDAGSTTTSGRVLDLLRKKGVDDIDVLVSTAGDPRRYGGLLSIAAVYQIEEFWWGGVSLSQDYRSTVEAVSEKAENTVIVKRGYEREFNGIKFEALNPKEPQFDDVNNDAVVLLLSDRNTTVLLLSNIQTGAQGDIVNTFREKIKADVIEAPYYGVGAGTANIAFFLQASKPRNAIICGCSDETMEVEGSTRLPFKRVMEQEQYHMTYYETYKLGTVKIVIDQNGYAIVKD
ncbi:MAG: MBL fold metallo-hydrolase [Candidatus Bilamarchaeaceae archaeon]